MNDLKITFPKLKAISERNTVKTLKIISNTVKTAVDNRSQRTEMTPLEEKLGTIKYHYVNKSPHYFKARNRSVQEYGPIKEASQTIEEYVGEHSRIVSKDMLLSLARDRLKRQRRHQYNKNKMSNEFQRTKLTKHNEEEQMKYSKYQNFRPLRIPLKSSIKYSLYQPEPKAKRTIG